MDLDNIFDNSVFRYRSCTKNAIDAFQNDHLYFSTPDHFNDPFDAVIYVNKDKLFKSIFRDWDQEMEAYLNDKVRDPSTFINLANKDLVLQCTQDPNLRAIFLSHIDKIIDDIKNRLLSNSKTICFCEEYLSTLMWSHYADYHKGFVLAYEKESLTNAIAYNERDELISATLKLGKIRYTAHMTDYGEFFYEFLPATLKDVPPALYSRFLAEMIFNKTKEWEYEKEWRLYSIPGDYTKPDPVLYLGIRPWAVFLGAKMPAQQKWQLYCIAKKKGIAVFEVWTNTFSSEFKLNFQKIDSRKLKEEASR